MAVLIVIQRKLGGNKDSLTSTRGSCLAVGIVLPCGGCKKSPRTHL